MCYFLIPIILHPPDTQTPLRPWQEPTTARVVEAQLRMKITKTRPVVVFFFLEQQWLRHHHQLHISTLICQLPPKLRESLWVRLLREFKPE
ncbi:hypothetical protein L484_002758 [Morus notabilis]|uniref:Uncharacterized protein n=1 Tax=Morus notabilis TaxID=981085 RepID=W9QZX4_9ROSA|nr:hypothetical protein L484_002758 [Morus notabilis]